MSDLEKIKECGLDLTQEELQLLQEAVDNFIDNGIKVKGRREDSETPLELKTVYDLIAIDKSGVSFGYLMAAYSLSQSQKTSFDLIFLAKMSDYASAHGLAFLSESGIVFGSLMKEVANKRGASEIADMFSEGIKLCQEVKDYTESKQPDTFH